MAFDNPNPTIQSGFYSSSDDEEDVFDLNSTAITRSEIYGMTSCSNDPCFKKN